MSEGAAPPLASQPQVGQKRTAAGLAASTGTLAAGAPLATASPLPMAVQSAVAAAGGSPMKLPRLPPPNLAVGAPVPGTVLRPGAVVATHLTGPAATPRLAVASPGATVATSGALVPGAVATAPAGAAAVAATKVTPPKPSPDGLILSGSWVLDKARSESMKPYLELMGLSDMAVEAWTKAEKETVTFKAIDLSGTHCRLTKRDRVQNTTETYCLGQEVLSDSKVEGQKKRVLVTSQHASHLEIKSHLPLKNGSMCSLTDTHRVMDAGITMHQELVAVNMKTKQQATINRYYAKTEPMHEVEEEEED